MSSAERSRPDSPSNVRLHGSRVEPTTVRKFGETCHAGLDPASMARHDSRSSVIPNPRGCHAGLEEPAPDSDPGASMSMEPDLIRLPRIDPGASPLR